MRALFLILILCIFNSLSAQEYSPTLEERIDVVPQMFRFSFLPLGFGFEQRIGLRQTLAINTKLALNPISDLQSAAFQTVFNPGLKFRIQYRAYLNMLARASRGKSIANNSGLYAGIMASYKTPSFNRNRNSLFENTAAVGPIFGVQQTFPSNINIDFSMGIGALFIDKNILPVPIGLIKFSYVIVPNKSRQSISNLPIFEDE